MSKICWCCSYMYSFCEAEGDACDCYTGSCKNCYDIEEIAEDDDL